MVVSKRKNAASTVSKTSDTTKNVTAKTTKKNVHSGEAIDVYIRMEDNPEKDYCFHVPADKPVSFLFKIFDLIPAKMSPGYFYFDDAETFALSVHPGYFTSEGCLLFHERAAREEFQKPISNDALIGDVIAEGQLIIPQWRYHYRRWLVTVLVLSVWLYLDLPEFISPTPGTAPSIWIHWLIKDYLPGTFGSVRTEGGLFESHIMQCLFFLFHVIKVSLFYLFLWNGAWHPTTLSPFAPYNLRSNKKPLPKPEDLSLIGWTGVRKTTPKDWIQKSLDYRKEISGGVVEAYKSGLLSKPIGYDLKPGEGWSVLVDKTLNDVKVEKDLLDAEGKFVVSKEYFLEVAKPLSVYVRVNRDENDKAKKLREYREFGYLDSSPTLKELFQDLVPMHKPN